MSDTYTQDTNFASKMKEEYIPTLEKMLLKEKEHLSFLEEQITKFKSKAAAKFKKDSEAYILHLETRIQEYINFINQ